MKKKYDPLKIMKMSCAIAAAMLVLTVSSPVGAYTPAQSADRAFEIAKQARDRIELSSKGVKVSSEKLFQEFAQRTAELQKLLDAHKALSQAGLLKKGDPDGEARRSHINGKILVEIGYLKETCDQNLDALLGSLENFDRAVANSLVDSQATRTINGNYELGLEQYMTQEKSRFEEALQDASGNLEAYQANQESGQKNRLLKNYQRAKKRVLLIEQRRKLYAARIKVAALNQQVSAVIREKIKEDGGEVSSRFRSVMAGLYNCFAKVVPIAESGGTGRPEVFASIGFPNIEKFKETLDIVEGAAVKLGTVLDGMVNDVLSGLGEIQVMDANGLSREALSIEEEMEFLHKQKSNWKM